MRPSNELIARLEAASGPDRRLDAELVARLAGPEECGLTACHSPDGWAVVEQGADGEACWMLADEVPPLTASLDEVHVFLAQTRPQDGSAIMARGLAALQPRVWETPSSFAGRLARSVLAELLRACERETFAPAASAA